MTRRTIIILCILLQFVLLGVALGFVIHGYLNSRRFQSLIVQELSNYVECDLRLSGMKNGLFSGLDMMDVVLTSPEVVPSQFLTIKRAQVRYDLLQALFHQKIIIRKILLQEPVLEVDVTQPLGKSMRRFAGLNSIFDALKTDSATGVNSLVSRKSSAVTEAPVYQPDPGGTRVKVGWPQPPAMDLPSFVVHGGLVTLRVAHGGRIVIHDMEARISLSSTPVPSGAGAISCGEVNLPEDTRLASAKINLLWRGDTLTIPSYAADLLGGHLEGEFGADQTKEGVPFHLTLAMQNVDAEEILQKAKWKEGRVEGRLRCSSRFEGMMVKPEDATGEGQLQIDGARLVNVSFLALLGGYLNRSDFRNLPLQMCDVDFELKKRRLTVSRLRIQSADFGMMGNGWIQFPKQNQEFWIKCRFAEPIAGQIPPQMVSGFLRKPDGSGELAFHTWGTLRKSETDLQINLSGAKSRAVGGAIFDQIFESIPKAKDESH